MRRIAEENNFEQKRSLQLSKRLKKERKMKSKFMTQGEDE